MDDEGELNPDTRTVRPEPFEHTFGAQAHPAEPAASDPSHTSASAPARSQEPVSAAEPALPHPDAAPEQ
jgi:hypothetical protein